MKTERYLWIAAIILAAFVVENQSNNNATLQTLVDTYNAESKIQDEFINEFNIQLNAARDLSYSRGFEDGRTQAGIALAKGDSLYDYKDGYHAALTQIVDEEGILEVSKGIMTELNTLRKMVPRLLNQVQKITQENEEMKISFGMPVEADYKMEVPTPTPAPNKALVNKEEK